MQKIIIFNPGSYFYGVEVSLLNVIEALKNDFAITVVLTQKGILEDLLKEKGIKVKIFSFPILQLSYSPLYYCLFVLKFFITLFYFIPYVIFNQFNFVYSNSALVIPTIFIAMFTGRKHIWHLREFFCSASANNFIGWLSNFSRINICMSDNIKRNLNLRKDNSVLIYEPVRSLTPKVSFSIRKELNINENAVIISMVSRIHPLKGQYEFLKSFKEIIINQIVKIIFIGDITMNGRRNVGYKIRLREFVEKENLKEKVLFLGFRLDALDIISQSDICVFPFLRNEPFGLAMAESLALGKKTLFLDNAGSREVNKLFDNAGEILTQDSLLRSISESRMTRGLKIHIPRELSFVQFKADMINLLNQR